MISEILNTFAKIASVPRPCHHEEKICSFLEEWASKLGFDYIRDNQNNLIVEAPSTAGMENKPKTALQGHTDMVFVQRPGLNLDPLTTKINVKKDGIFLTSDGSTSLGADDGIGMAIMMNIAEGKMKHGPLKLIFTTGEEDGMTGTFALDPKVLSDIEYLINLDSEEEGTVCLSTAAGVIEYFNFEYKKTARQNIICKKIALNELTGGHSGIDIDKGRLNAIKAIGDILKSLDENNISYELAGISGGYANNAIPSNAEATICISTKDAENAVNILEQCFQIMKADNIKTDPEMKLSVSELIPPEYVADSDTSEKVLSFINGFFDGVYTMSENMNGTVESSSNLGKISFNDNVISVGGLVRSSNTKDLDELLDSHSTLAEKLGFGYSTEKTAYPWPFNPDNKLYAIARNAYKKLFNKELLPQTLHAGLECGTFCVYNPGLDMISLGPTIRSPHSVKESLEIATVDKIWLLIEEILKNV